MRETKTHTIDGFTYQVTQLGGKLGKKVLAHLMRVVGPVFEADDPVAKFASSLTDEELDYFCDTFAKTTMFSSDAEPDKVFDLPSQFDLHFTARYGAMLKWLWACIDTNYSTFLAELGLTPELRDQLLTAVKAEMFAPKTTAPSGSSGASSLRASAS